MDLRARPLPLLAILLLAACGSSTTSATLGPETAPRTVALPPPTPDTSPPDTSAPEPPPPRVQADRDQGPKRFGLSKEEAINVCQPGGERRYLARLRCADGQPPEFRRRGNVGQRNERQAGATEADLMRQMDMSRPLDPGEVDYHIVDLYEVVCSNKTYEIFMDMYHCADPPVTRAPRGFTVLPPE